MAKLNKTTQSVQSFLAECKAYGFHVHTVNTTIVLTSYFQPSDVDTFNLLNQNAVNLMNRFKFKNICESNGLGAQVALDTGVIDTRGQLTDRFIEILNAELCLG